MEKQNKLLENIFYQLGGNPLNKTKKANNNPIYNFCKKCGKKLEDNITGQFCESCEKDCSRELRRGKGERQFCPQKMNYRPGIGRLQQRAVLSGLEFRHQCRNLRPGIFLPQFANFVLCQLIASLIVGMAGMALNPLPGNGMLSRQLVELTPKVLVFDRFLVERFPPPGFPSPHPAGNAIFEILRISENRGFTRLCQRPQGRNGGLHFHPIVGRGRRASAHLPAEFLVTQDSRPAPRPGIALASAIGINHDLFQGAG